MILAEDASIHQTKLLVCSVSIPWNALLAIVLLNALVAVMATVYGLAHTIPLVWQGAVYRCLAVVLLGLMLWVLALAWLDGGRVSDRNTGMQVLAGLCLLQLCLTLFFNLPTRFAGAAIVAVWVVGGLLARAWGAAALVIFSMIAGFAIYIGGLALVPQSTPGADMLPFISHAIDIFKAGGDPYAADYSSIDSNPFFYGSYWVPGW